MNKAEPQDRAIPQPIFTRRQAAIRFPLEGSSLLTANAEGRERLQMFGGEARERLCNRSTLADNQRTNLLAGVEAKSMPVIDIGEGVQREVSNFQRIPLQENPHPRRPRLISD